jgi:hypothetical protein
MPTTAHPIEQLEQLAAEYHHWSQEYRREGEQGSTRRTIEKHLKDLDEHFDSLLAHWVDNEPVRQAWYEHLRHDGPRPEDELVQYPPIFVGHSDSGSEVQIRPNAEGTYDVLVDSIRADRLLAEMTFPQNSPTRIVGQEWMETTNLNATALAAFRRFFAGGKGKIAAPWEWARVLYGDGLIDVNFGLTARGRRILNRSA